ncbi:hypothetical protein [Streptomyces sp. MP131-18]|uniref:hypothetical protein n=1 Tax=Streptomyces sp. MP131-18 TaxID=1857892 RepID=UPI00097BA804|nr:hypothetical protein [Streptomyces sp. MP131-18]ONK15805.1 hypothetical protein STBA_66460 [Streptomyces sp. MP131-18]
MRIEHEITFALDGVGPGRAIDALSGRVPLFLDGTAAQARPRIRRKARLYAYVRETEVYSDRWVLNLVDQSLTRVVKQRVSPVSKTESVREMPFESLACAAEFTAVFVKLKFARAFRHVPSGRRFKAALDLMVPVRQDWRLAGGGAFWHLEIEARRDLPAAAALRLGDLPLSDADRIAESKAQGALRRLGAGRRPHAPAAGGARAVFDAVRADLWPPAWAPPGLRGLLASAALDDPRHFVRTDGAERGTRPGQKRPG